MPKKKGGDIAQDAYDATASFGLFMAFIQAIGVTLISLLAIGIGIYLVSMKSAYQGTTMATITNSKCTTINQGTKCVIDYEYTVNNKKYSRTGSEVQGAYVTGNKVKVSYDTSNPDNHSVLPINWKFIGWICIIIGFIMVIVAWLWFYIANTYKVAAAATGVGTIVDMTTTSLHTE